MTIKIKSKVRCSDREVGEVSRVIIDPIAKSISHVVVQSDGTERVVPLDEQAVITEGLVQFGFPSSKIGQYPPLERGNYQQVKEVEIAGLERHLEVFPGEALVPVPTLERDLSRRAFFTNFTNAIGVVLALPLVYPVFRYLTFPMFPTFPDTNGKLTREMLQRCYEMASAGAVSLLINSHFLSPAVYRGQDEAVPFLGTLLTEHDRFQVVLREILEDHDGLTVGEVYAYVCQRHDDPVVRHYLSMEYPDHPMSLQQIITVNLTEMGYAAQGPKGKQRFYPPASATYDNKSLYKRL